VRFDAIALREGVLAELWPSLPCPACDSDSIEIDPGGVNTEWSSLSARERERHPDWEPEWIKGVFAAVAQCSRKQCAEPVAISGRFEVDLLPGPPDYDGSLAYGNVLAPRAMTPAPPLITVPATTPQEVAGHVRDAFGLFWQDLDAAATRGRTAVERLLTERGRRQYAQGKKRTRLSAHARLLEWDAAERHRNRPREQVLEAIELLLAVKWIGNVGTHADSRLAPSKVADGFDLLSRALTLLYDDSATELRRRARQISKAKGR
jgi:hypothetical protein